MRKCHPSLMVSLLMATAALPVKAVPEQAADARMYGQGAPFTLDQLPAGPLRASLEALPAQAKARAIDWLHGFAFPAEDAGYLRADAQGAILYADAYQPEPAAQAIGIPEPVSAVDPNTAFMLHSKPGASKTLYLDFDGHRVENTAWNANAEPSYQARPFDPNGTNGFDDDELARIAEIWHRVAEDLAPFDIDVTTEDPITFGPQTGRVLITHNTDAHGRAMPYSSAGGVAYANVWGLNNYPYYSPALVYYNNLGNGYAPYVAEAAAHEFGHNLGLSHDGSSTASYYTGHGADSSLVSWAPVMGVGYYKNVTQWSKGEYPGANNTQDDLAIIASGLGLRSDDHGDVPASATALVADATGQVVSSNPQTDAFNDASGNKGVIESRTDVDLFYVDVGAGPLTLSALPAWDAFYRGQRRGANLDLELALLDEGGVVLAKSDPVDNTDGTVSASLAAGRYYLRVRGVGNSATPYSDYASLGQYFFEGSITLPGGSASNQAPTARFTHACTALDCSFSDASSDSDGSISAWGWDFGDGTASTLQNPSHSFASAGTYAVTLTVTDDQGLSDTVQSAIVVSTPDLPPPSVPGNLIAADNGDGTATLGWDASAEADSYELLREKQHKNGRWVDNSVVASGLTGTAYTDPSGVGTYRYRVRAVNAQGGSDWSPWVGLTVTGGATGDSNAKCHPKRGC
ncbi:PKD domain-containing protein [Motiliproteus sp. SC1-56]|uniref:PKD domain-containing protein n=1 Tax=Motiliproteus sp. SC1-56 TaxID=2799565 RepID=UPI001A8CABF2|nr:PKD domain-containing protein [Motiliproteus sp. SC1-56]